MSYRRGGEEPSVAQKEECEKGRRPKKARGTIQPFGKKLKRLFCIERSGELLTVPGVSGVKKSFVPRRSERVLIDLLEKVSGIKRSRAKRNFCPKKCTTGGTQKTCEKRQGGIRILPESSKKKNQREVINGP